MTLAALLCAMTTACVTADQQAAPTPQGGTKVNRALPRWMFDLPLTDQDGQRVTLGEFKGKVVVLTDFLTLCREVCPLTSANIRLLQRKAARAGLGGRVEFLEITVDPARDTPARLHAYTGLAGSAPNWKLLTGAPAELAKLWRLLGVGYSKRPLHRASGRDWWTGKPLRYDVDHTDALIYLDRSGAERYVITGIPNAAAARLAARLKATLNQRGQRNLTHPGAAAWTLRQAMSSLRWVVGSKPSPG